MLAGPGPFPAADRREERVAALLEEVGRAAVEMRPGGVPLEGRAQAGERWRPRHPVRARLDGQPWGRCHPGGRPARLDFDVRPAYCAIEGSNK